MDTETLRTWVEPDDPCALTYQLPFHFIRSALGLSSISGSGGLPNEFVDTVVVNMLNELMNLHEEFVQVIKLFCEIFAVAYALLKDVFDFALTSSWRTIVQTTFSSSLLSLVTSRCTRSNSSFALRFDPWRLLNISSA